MSENYTPVTIERQANQEDPKMMDLFFIDGKVYQIPAKPKVNVALKYLWEAKTIGELPAATNLLVALIGEEGFKALTEYEDLTPDQFNSILSGATKLTLGALNQSLGNSESGPGK
jgi:hypothetical protein